MRFGVFYELQLPKPWNERDEQRLFNEALDQVALADRLGIDYAWAVEHHFLEEYSHCSAPKISLPPRPRERSPTAFIRLLLPLRRFNLGYRVSFLQISSLRPVIPSKDPLTPTPCATASGLASGSPHTECHS